ncbi:hypothetical protein H8E65_00405 [Candidatus Bathyarchaeota archaeon]|nr:hypothetical protein [Candidatus Bathyarchaeota archaeon]
MPYHGADSDAVNEVLQRIGAIISQSPSTLQKRITERLCNLLRSEAAAQVFIRLCREKADTPYVLTRELDIPSRTIYNALTRLRTMGLVVETQPFRGGVRPGAKAGVFALTGYDPADLLEAVARDRVLRAPSYAEVKRIAQLLLDDYLPIISHGNTLNGKVYKTEINRIVRRVCRGVHFLDVLPLIEVELKNKGLVVL